MPSDLRALLIAAAAAGFVHTLLGPDHYLPFIMISWARKWSRAKTAIITFLCGIGHIASSVILGAIGVALGLVVGNLEAVESARGDVAAWLLIAFGLAYTVWGIRRAYKNRPHVHKHFHPDIHAQPCAGSHEHDETGPHEQENEDDHDHSGLHEHEHSHTSEHSHIHNEHAPAGITPWMLFIIFVFGPCEVLIPFLMYPAAEKLGIASLIAVTGVFALTTLATMMAVVMLGHAGVNFLPLKKVQRYAHIVAGATILICGLAILLGL